MLPPSIFNDVIGPVMRGPSSSHVAAALRIGQLLRMAVKDRIVRVVVTFDLSGSLVESYHGHGSDMGLIAGLLGLSMQDANVINAVSLAVKQGLRVDFKVADCGAIHPSNYHIQVFENDNSCHVWQAISIGGGMIELYELDGFRISVNGDYYEIFLHCAANTKKHLRDIELRLANEISVECIDGTSGVLWHMRSDKPLPKELTRELSSELKAKWALSMEPILPSPSPLVCKVPFLTVEEMLCECELRALPIWRMALLYESARSGCPEQQVFGMMDEIAKIMQQSVREGMQITSYQDRILGAQAYKMLKCDASQKLAGPLLSMAIQNITAIMEVKSAMGVIVAAPTAGSCGCLAGTLTAAQEVFELDKNALIKALLTAGMIGVFIAMRATFAAEVAGCQAECGSGSAMAAAALSEMFGATPRQCVDAASVALQNMTGLACDPIANRVEVPCLGKNILGGSNAVSAAAVIIAGFDAVIPLEETIDAMLDSGKHLPLELRCTCGGLGKSKTSQAIRRKLEEKCGIL